MSHISYSKITSSVLVLDPFCACLSSFLLVSERLGRREASTSVNGLDAPCTYVSIQSQVLFPEKYVVYRIRRSKKTTEPFDLLEMGHKSVPSLSVNC